MISQMLIGSVLTLKIFFVTIIFSIPAGFILMILYTSKNKIVKDIAGFYILIMRGTPLLLQVFFVYYGLPKVLIFGYSIKFDAFTACAIAFILNYAAYIAEIFRGSLLAVDKGQFEAAKVLGLSKKQAFIKIITPQMFRVALPSISNEAIILVKDTALASVLTLHELLAVTKTIVNRTGDLYLYGVSAIFYLTMSYGLTVFFRELEKKYNFE